MRTGPSRSPGTAAASRGRPSTSTAAEPRPLAPSPGGSTAQALARAMPTRPRWLTLEVWAFALLALLPGCRAAAPADEDRDRLVVVNYLRLSLIHI